METISTLEEFSIVPEEEIRAIVASASPLQENVESAEEDPDGTSSGIDYLLVKLKKIFKDAFQHIMMLEKRNQEIDKQLRDLQDRYHNDVTSLSKEIERLKRELEGRDKARGAGAGSKRPDVHNTAIIHRGSRLPRPLS
ncbi:hypothetical protein BDR22DRAFT_241119 [Usnea florida]